MEELMSEGRDLLQKGKYEEAIDKYIEVINVDNQAHAATHNISICYQRKGDWGKALEYVNRAIGKNATISKYFNSKGTILFQLKRLDEAKRAWEEGLRLDPQNKTIESNLSMLKAPPPAPSPRPRSSSGSGGPIGTLGADGFPNVIYPRPEAPSTTLFGRVILALRLLSLLLIVAYLLPVDQFITRSSFRLAMYVTAACNAGALGGHIVPIHWGDWKAISTQAQQMAMSIMSDLGLPPIMYSVVLAMYSAQPTPVSLLIAAPALLLNFFYAGEAACAVPALGGVLSPLASFFSARLVPSIAGLTGAVRRKELVRGLVKRGISWEVYSVILLIFLLATPLRNFGLVIALAGTQYMKFSFNVFTRETFREIHAWISLTLGRWLPAATPAYTWLSTLLYNQATSAVTSARERAR